MGSEPSERSRVPNNARPGDVLADRYRLVDLMTESGGGKFWRAFDGVLERHVALHVIAQDDERASGLLEAARRSATVPDRHLLRVLDADRVDEVCFVVNEWADGSSLDVLLAHDGPLAARRAAWLVAEVAGSIANAHDAGVAHGRLVPENVLIDRTGSVRVIGFAVDAALHGLPAGRISTDVADLGGLLYCALTGTWPGVSRSQLGAAPHDNGRVLRPRQVRAGIPRPLDALCDTLVNPYVGPGSLDRTGHDLSTARGIADYLSEFVGDDTGMAETEAGLHPAPHDQETMVFSPLPQDQAPEAAPGTAPETAPETTPNPEPEATAAPTPKPAEPEQPTQAGLPIFDDETDDVSWLAARETVAPPPPPFEEPPERPLFAPAPDQGQPVRRSRPGSSATNGGQDFWPWDTGTGTGTGVTPIAVETGDEDDTVPGRSWMRLAAAIAVGLVLLVAIVVAYNLGRGRTPLGAATEPESPTASPTQAEPEPVVLTGLTAVDFDPQGSPPEENPELAPLSVDGDPTTSWRTLTYKQNLGPGGLKTGVGLTLDLGTSTDVTGLAVQLVGASTDVSFFVTDKAPSDVEGLSPAGQVTVAGGDTGEVTLDEAVTGRFVTLWLTSLPSVKGGFRGEVSEVSVEGVPAS